MPPRCCLEVWRQCASKLRGNGRRLNVAHIVRGDTVKGVGVPEAPLYVAEVAVVADCQSVKAPLLSET